jgi:hypothetical protein
MAVGNMTSHAQKPDTGSLARLWIGILAGPLAWAATEVISYTAAAHECSTGSRSLLHALTVTGLVCCAVGLIAARSVVAIYPRISDARSERIRSMAISGMTLSIAFAVAIIAMSIPNWILSPCD